ncbi:transglutaminase family protein [Rubellimicrobium aerolatum]|uniref:Transglutaminase domain-containing protein n=1 Tax=Rubellimicrobium aerolatum TaxID=490979 RepID=A0ABW0SCA6_9RHOB|nr:transglutaminase family protein [Rubellimicrobium aerolatum]MBP1806011.1 transglutaminase-like putative cysteine protease [Rubellimicrobium aerolatum]
MTDHLRLRVRHVTTYDYDAPVPWGLQQVRLRPCSHRWQRVLSWSLTVEGGRREAAFEDQHRNAVDLVSLDPGTTRLAIAVEGEVEVADTAGIVGPQSGFGPLWLFQRPTPRTTAGPACARLVESIAREPSPLHRLHDLSAAISDAVRYETGVTHVGWTAEDAVAAGHGVCQDQAHAFIACARAMGIPARYVSGYLLMEQEAQDAAHAWAEAWVPDLGWVGFDAANRISPDHRYVRVATGLDYGEAAPVSGARTGTGAERLTVAVEVRAQ